MGGGASDGVVKGGAGGRWGWGGGVGGGCGSDVVWMCKSLIKKRGGTLGVFYLD